MSHRVKLTPLDWTLLQHLRTRAAEASYDPSVLPALAVNAIPHISDVERHQLAAAEARHAPFGALLGLRLRSNPGHHAPAIADWLRQHAPNLLDTMLIELALVAPTVELEIEHDLFLAYYSPSYRWYLCGMADPAAGVEFDGPAVIVAAAGGRVPPAPADVVLYTDTEVRAQNSALEALPPDFEPIGDVRHLYEFCDDFVAPNFLLRERCQLGLTQLRVLYSDCAQRSLGLKIIT